MMARRKKTLQEQIDAEANEIRREIAHWCYMREYGCSDPSWPDGVNMNLTRNHVIYGKRRMEELCAEAGVDLPEEYYLPAPPKGVEAVRGRYNERQSKAVDAHVSGLGHQKAGKLSRAGVDVLKRVTNKYRNQKVVTPHGTFDSKREYRRYQELLLLQRAGKISELRRQVKYELLPSQRLNGKCVERPLYYIADFVYTKDNGEVVVEDVKGYRDPASAGYAKYVIKRKLMLYRYGIRVREV